MKSVLFYTTNLFIIANNHMNFLFFSSYINQRNRLRNEIEKEAAMKQEFQDMRNAVADPFTRRHSRPTLVTKVR